MGRGAQTSSRGGGLGQGGDGRGHQLKARGQASSTGDNDLHSIVQCPMCSLDGPCPHFCSKQCHLSNKGQMPKVGLDCAIANVLIQQGGQPGLGSLQSSQMVLGTPRQPLKLRNAFVGLALFHRGGDGLRDFCALDAAGQLELVEPRQHGLQILAGHQCRHAQWRGPLLQRGCAAQANPPLQERMDTCFAKQALSWQHLL